MRSRTKTIVVFSRDLGDVERAVASHLETGWTIIKQMANSGLVGMVVTLKRAVNYP